jgi:hypothetical protein
LRDQFDGLISLRGFLSTRITDKPGMIHRVTSGKNLFYKSATRMAKSKRDVKAVWTV